MITAAEIRTKYPHPTRFSEHIGECYLGTPYCVGGAFLMATGSDKPFPTPVHLSTHLMCANPLLGPAQAMYAAGEITCQNDTGNFDMAWQALDEALTYGQNT